MKKLLVSLCVLVTLLGGASSASAHGGRGGYEGGWHRGGWHGGGWAPFAVGAVAGAVIANAYYRPAPVYYGPPAYYRAPIQQTAAFCPENGLYYPQTQACPSGWQRVVY
ncbi:hypothetical protein [Polynucleobacter sp. AP-Nino-20-G2]|uniref:hypothetical protein n=1 Tax=Polynucleobacter sp. AP-Nino-20-G2 TaxID=2576917 RepID=UPI001BFD69B3|nr:hypothetical protein [Polynucleobacter sp. AP-Nino-20-G2]QWE17171.1 hypothetical protein FD960_02830 [Polynucleobacter sp. AP-Nino-20-G2]